MIHHQVKVNLYSLKSSHTVTRWEYPISSKELAKPNVENQAKWYV